MTGKWVSLTEACQSLGISESTLRRRIKEGKIESKLEDSRRLVFVDSDIQPFHIDGQMTITASDLVQRLKEEVEHLRQELDRRNEQIENLQKQLGESQKAVEEASHRHDTVVMQMTRLLEYHQQPFWRKLFFRKALPAPIDKTVLNMETDGNKGKQEK